MNRVLPSPRSLLQDFFISKGLVFKPDSWLRDGDQFITGEVHNPHDVQVKKTRRFLFKKLGADKVQWNKICSIQAKKIYGHWKKLVFVVFGRDNLPMVEEWAHELKKVLKQDLLVELRCEEKPYFDSKEYLSDEVINSRYSAARFAVIFSIVVCAVILGLKFFLENFEPSRYDLHSMAMTWPKLAMIYWILRLLMLFF